MEASREGHEEMVALLLSQVRRAIIVIDTVINSLNITVVLTVILIVNFISTSISSVISFFVLLHPHVPPGVLVLSYFPP